MTALDPNHLRDITSFDDVIEYLTDELDWPIGAENLDDATFDWDIADELGLPAERVPHLVSLRQLRPLEIDQPWGIFFLEFDGPRLPLTALRRLLDKLVTKKRATGSGTRRTWDLNDLLFIITTSTGDTVELHFIAFFEQPDKPAEIRSIPWRPGQSPAQHLRRLATELLPHLAWPDDPAAVDEWREEWRSAFKLRHGEAIASAVRLAERMADTAQGLRSEVAAALVAENQSGPFNTLMGEVREQLVGSVTAASFADMCAQTLVYGVLTSRITDPISFGASPTLAAVPLSNPFLATFFDQVHDQASVLDLEGIGLEQLVADLRETNVEAILDQFGASARGGDPVIHFYEEFLQRYDRKMRADAGAFYTPQPVVEFMTRTVDTILRDRFALAAGIADGATWSEVAARNGLDVPEGVDPSSPFVSMLDPATGTGTFLVEWLRRARASFLNGSNEEDWPGHARDVVLPSLHAFELMLGPYAIAHLKVALELHDDGVGDASVSILLTDTLDQGSQGQQLFGDDPVSDEGVRAEDLKQSSRFTVCIGNPPYDREQQGGAQAAKRKGGIVRHGAPGISPLIDDVTRELRDLGLSRHALSVYNDYVYFWRWAMWQVVERSPGPGIVALITAASFIDGVSMAGLRSLMRDRFDQLIVVDLGGDSRSVSVDENVFDIRTPVAICFAVRHGMGTSEACTVRYVSLRGTRLDKLERLSRLSLDDAEFVEVEGIRGDRLSPTGISDSAVPAGVSLTDVFPWSARGIQFSRTWPVGPSKTVLKRRWRTLVESHRSRRPDLLKETRDVRVDGDYRSFLTGGRLSPVGRLRGDAEPDAIREVTFRSFDAQFCIADRRVIDMPRPPLWRSAEGDGQIFLVSIPGQGLGPGPILVAGTGVPDLNAFNNRGGLVLPMTRGGAGVGRPFNVAGGLLEALAEAYGESVEPVDVVTYVYGLLGSPAFFARFGAALAHENPNVPFTANKALFDEVAELGRQLLWLHTAGRRLGDSDPFPSASAQEISRVTSYPEGFVWDGGSRTLSVGDGSFGPIDRDVWEFEVSGLKVLQSWLGYRMKAGKGKKSSPLDDIRPERWTFTPELLTLLAILEQTVALTPRAAELLDRVVAGDLIDPATLPIPTDAERKAPRG